jgi:hypothetical protein
VEWSLIIELTSVLEVYPEAIEGHPGTEEAHSRATKAHYRAWISQKPRRLTLLDLLQKWAPPHPVKHGRK